MAFVARWLSLSRNREYEKGIRAFDQALYDQAISHFTACLEETNEPATVPLASAARKVFSSTPGNKPA